MNVVFFLSRRIPTEDISKMEKKNSLQRVACIESIPVQCCPLLYNVQQNPRTVLSGAVKCRSVPLTVLSNAVYCRSVV